MRLQVAVLSWALAAAAGQAHADGPYVSAAAGASFLDSALNASGPGFQIISDYATGWLVRGAAGYGFDNGLRLEGEVGYRRNGFKRLRISKDGGLGAAFGGPPLDGATIATTGDEDSLSFMGNLWYDCRSFQGFTPYVGGGLGFSRVQLNKIAIPGLQLVDDRDYVFAYQAGVGVAYALTPSASITLDYRFFGTADPTVRDFAGVAFTTEYQSHSVSVGFRLGL